MAEWRFLSKQKRTNVILPSGGPSPSDELRIRDILQGLGYSLRTKAGRSYALRLQDEAWNIVTEARTWAAIGTIANRLLKRGFVPGRCWLASHQPHEAYWLQITINT